MNEQEERGLMELMRAQAKMTRTFYDGLIEQNFTVAQALALTHTWLDAQSRRPPEIKA